MPCKKNNSPSSPSFVQNLLIQFLLETFISLGAQSFEHANVLYEKINFSALGGPKVAIFGRDDLDPLYFDVINFAVPPAFVFMSPKNI